MKRSRNVTLVVMGTLAFSASFAAGSAFLAWHNPASSQTCTTAPDGVRTCVASHTPAGFARYVQTSIFPWRSTSTASPVTTTETRWVSSTESKWVGTDARWGTNAGSVSGPPVGAHATEGTSRGGFGAIARAAFHHSVAS